jgi:dihydroorotate dehydrogenase electron transfer subunit
MPAPPADARSRLATVIRCLPCGADAVVLTIRLDEDLPPVRASRFFMLRREDGSSPAIPRPFSLYRQAGRDLEFLIKVMGQGTRALADAPIGAPVRAIGPLGNGWPPIHGGQHGQAGGAAGPPWVLLAGGVGSAPFYLGIVQALRGMDGHPPVAPGNLHFLFGAASAKALYDLEAFRALGVPVHVATMDGSSGLRGHVLQLLERLQAQGALPSRVRILACGPERMLEAVQALAIERELDAWLSLETWMGCGVGICNGCPIPTRPDGPRGGWPNVKCCVEGPVFHVREIELGRSLSAAAPACSPAAS